MGLGKHQKLWRQPPHPKGMTCCAGRRGSDAGWLSDCDISWSTGNKVLGPRITLSPRLFSAAVDKWWCNIMELCWVQRGLLVLKLTVWWVYFRNLSTDILLSRILNRSFLGKKKKGALTCSHKQNAAADIVLWILMKLLCSVARWVSTLHVSLPTHQYRLGGSASLSPFTQKGDICSLLVSDGSSLLVDISSGEIRAVYKKFSVGDMKRNLIRRAIGNREAPAGLIRAAVLMIFTQLFTSFSIFYDFNPHSLNTELWPGSLTISSQSVSEVLRNNTPCSRSHNSQCNQHQLEIIHNKHFPQRNQITRQTRYTNIGVCAKKCSVFYF